MLSESVAQKAIIAVNDGKKSGQKEEPQPTLPLWLRIGPKPWAALTIQARRNTPISSTKGAAQFSKRRTISMPRRMIAIWITQKIAKLSHWVHGVPKIGAALIQPLPKSAPARV